MAKMFLPFLCVSLLCAVSTAAKATVDTIAPSGRWTAPARFSVLTTDTIRVAVEGADNPGGSGIDRVVYYASYLDSHEIRSPKVLVGEVSKPPYEVLWDCSHIRDQCISNLHFFCEIIDKAGNRNTSTELSRTTEPHSGRYNEFTLDRNPGHKSISLTSRRRRVPIDLDGRLDDWAHSDSVEFPNGDNRVCIRSLWNKNSLYFGVVVYDSDIVLNGKPIGDRLFLSLDPDHSRDPIRHGSDIQYRFVPTGGDLNIQTYDTMQIFSSDAPASYQVTRLLKATGNGFEHPTGYAVELVIPWSELFDVRPGRGKVLGLDVVNYDCDRIGGLSTITAWSGTPISAKCNSSEWGNLVLEDPWAWAMPWAWVTGIAALFAGVALSIRRIALRRRFHRLNAPTGRLNMQVAKRFIETHYNEPDLSLEKVAGRAGFSRSHFSRLFRKEFGSTFADYLAGLRLEAARRLLRDTSNSIAQVALASGFADPDYFCRVFKKATGMSPSAFRSEN
jgi:AraC-like DNA-binding protein